MFTASDVEILDHAVSIHPNLELACHATVLAKKHLDFPVKSHEELSPLFAVVDLPGIMLDSRFNAASIGKLFPCQFFPIEDSRDFLGKILATLSWGDTLAHHEQFIAKPERFSPVGFKDKPPAGADLLDSKRIDLNRPGAWVPVEEVWLWELSIYRHLAVPGGVSVTLRHNFGWPPYHWEPVLGEGFHSFYCPNGWNKFQVKLNSPARATVEWHL